MIHLCPFCQMELEAVKDTNRVCLYYRCFSCHITQEFVGDSSITWLGCAINKKEFTVRLDAYQNKTIITSWISTDDGFGISDKEIVFPGLLNFTPSNVVEKLKTYLIFS